MNRPSPRSSQPTRTFLGLAIVASLATILVTTSKLLGFSTPTLDPQGGHLEIFEEIHRRVASAEGQHRHVLMGLSGNATGFIEEFEASIKSILINAPIWNPLTIHIMADDSAFLAVNDVLHNKANLPTLVTNLPLSINVYNVQQYETEWLKLIEQRMATAAKFTSHSLYRHTVGAYYRLFAHKVLDPSVESVVYVDTDTVILAAMDQIWDTSTGSDSTLFYWGPARCSGFMLLLPNKLEEVWTVFQGVPENQIKKMMRNRPVASDQLVFKSINSTYPELVGVLPVAWDNHANEMLRNLSVIDDIRPEGVGMLHYNGGRTSKEAFFKEHQAMKNKHWALSRYYVDMPWSWLHFLITSRIPSYQRGHRVTINKL